MKSKCKWCREGMVFDKECTKVIRKFICDIDYYDEDIGCNPNCHGYCREKEEEDDDER